MVSLDDLWKPWTAHWQFFRQSSKIIRNKDFPKMFVNLRKIIPKIFRTNKENQITLLKYFAQQWDWMVKT